MDMTLRDFLSRLANAYGDEVIDIVGDFQSGGLTVENISVDDVENARDDERGGGMCARDDCPLAESCYRQQAEPDKFRQSHFRPEFAGHDCGYYLPVPADHCEQPTSEGG